MSRRPVKAAGADDVAVGLSHAFVEESEDCDRREDGVRG